MTDLIEQELLKAKQWFSEKRPAAWYPDQAQAFSIWADAVYHPDASVREEAAFILGYFKPEKAEPILEELWYDPIVHVRIQSLNSLYRMKSTKTEEKAIQAINDRNEYLRIAAIRILRDINSEYYVKAYKFLENQNSKLIQEALRDL
jgi:HEAT repeat protein